MRCFVVVLAMAACVGPAASAAAPAASCATSMEFFARYNASADDSDQPGRVCGGECCGRGREELLRTSLRRLAIDRTIAETRPVAELLLSTRRTLQDHLTQLSHQSQNKTGGLFTQLYRNHATRIHRPLNILYEDIRTSIRTSAEHDMLEGQLGSQPPRDLAESARNFFEDVFPMAYQSVLKLEAKQFTREYEACLRDAYDVVKPFGDIPQKMGTSLSRSLKAARALLEVLAAGAGVLAASEHVLASTSEDCSNHLLLAVGCSHCKGHHVKPCRAYCLNVARGCIGSLVAELDAPWAGYVEGLERLVRVEADVVLREIEGKISEAIMYALENHVTLENKVRQECGPTATSELSLSSPAPTVATRRIAFTVPPPDAIILEFAASLAESKKLFEVLADEVCDEPDFAEIANDNCWNGKAVGEYTKPLVVSASLVAQKYNPEVPNAALQDSKVAEVAALGDKLRQARQLLVTNSWGGDTPAAESFMQGDEAGEEGSGSGRIYDDDGSYDQEGSGEEGSGMHDIGSRQENNDEEQQVHVSPPKTAAATTSRPLLSLVFSVAMLATFRRCLT